MKQMTSEQHSPAPDSRETQALNDIATLAFWGVDFQSCDDDLRSRVPSEEQGNIFDSRLREKEGHDYTRGCGFTALQLQGTIYNNGGLETIDLILVYWQDGYSAAVNTVDLYTEQRALADVDTVLEPSADAHVLINQVKKALSQLVDIAS